MITDYWPYKMLAAGITTVYCFLFGGSEIILLTVIIFIGLDTLTKWAAITKKYLVEQGHPEEKITTTDMVCGFFYAWKPGYLTSANFRQCWAEKIFTYSILVMFAGLMTKLPEMVLFGTPVNKSISGGIYSCIAMSELFSITENLEEMGNRRLAQLKQFLCTLTNKVTGGNFSITVSNNEEEKKDV